MKSIASFVVLAWAIVATVLLLTAPGTPTPVRPAAAPCPEAPPLDERTASAVARCEAGELSGCRAAYLGAMERDPALATRVAEKMCTGGDPRMCETFGYRLAKGQGIAADCPRALELLRKACAADASDCFYLGLTFEKERAPEALEAYQRGCGAKHALSCKSAGDVLIEGLVPRDPAAASGLYDAACQLGNQAGCVGLIKLLERGELGPPDPARLAELKKRACTQGHLASCAR